ncbi:hypothetical protein J4223_03955 [Candidatus Woesearchaeota archaeon]|nr:hypothetical protein [Candidatus Woesearchaeota archaeon]
MFYLAPIVVFFGLVINYSLKKRFSSELKQLTYFLKFSEKFFLLLIISFSIYLSFSLSIWFFIFLFTGIILGFFLRETLLYLGIQQTIFNLYLSSLSFIYLLFTKEKLSLKNTLLFFLPMLVIFLPVDPWIFLALSSGSLIPQLFQ